MSWQWNLKYQKTILGLPSSAVFLWTQGCNILTLKIWNNGSISLSHSLIWTQWTTRHLKITYGYQNVIITTYKAKLEIVWDGTCSSNSGNSISLSRKTLGFQCWQDKKHMEDLDGEAGPGLGVGWKERQGWRLKPLIKDTKCKTTE